MEITLSISNIGGASIYVTIYFNWAITLTFPDFGSKGSLVGIIIGQPPKMSSNDGGSEGEDR